MTTPSGQPEPAFDPYTGRPLNSGAPEPAASAPETSSPASSYDEEVRRHPYTESDFGMTPRAIGEPLASSPQVHDPSSLEGVGGQAAQGAGAYDHSTLNAPAEAKSLDGAVRGAMAAGAAALGAAAHSVLSSKRDDHEPVTSDKRKRRKFWERGSDDRTRRNARADDAPQASEGTREHTSRWAGSARVRRSDPGIWVPLGFGCVAVAMLLARVLFPVSDGRFKSALLVVLVGALILAALSTLNVLYAARRRRRAGQDFPHAIGLE